MDLSEYLVVFCMAPAEEAEMIAEAVVKDRLVACVNTTKAQSRYWWKGSINTKPEHLLIMKTQKSRFEALISRIRELHSYEVPEVIAIPIIGSYDAYLDWIKEETS